MGYYQATDAAMTLPGLNRAPKEMNAKGFDLLCKFFCRLNSFVACGSVHYNSWIAIVFIIKSSQTHKYVLEIVDKD